MKLRHKRCRPTSIPVICKGIRFDMPVSQGTTHREFVKNVAALFSVIPYFVAFKHKDENWKLGQYFDEPINILFGEQRGSVQRTVSTTLRWDEGSGSTDSPSPRARYDARLRGSRSRARSESRSIHSTSTAASAIPVSPPPAQRETVRRMARDRNGLVGRVHATPDALAGDVLRDVSNELSLAQSPRYRGLVTSVHGRLRCVTNSIWQNADQFFLSLQVSTNNSPRFPLKDQFKESGGQAPSASPHNNAMNQLVCCALHVLASF